MAGLKYHLYSPEYVSGNSGFFFPNISNLFLNILKNVLKMRQVSLFPFSKSRNVSISLKVFSFGDHHFFSQRINRGIRRIIWGHGASLLVQY